MKRFVQRMTASFGVVIGCLLVQNTIADEPSESVDPVFRAGAATSNITPPLGELIVGGWTPIPAEHVHDELHARCLVLDDGTVQLGIVLCDNVGIPDEVFQRAKELVQKTIRLPPSHVLMAATHTHSATTASGGSKVIQDEEFTEYQTFLVRRIADGLRRAWNQLEPAQIAWGSVDEPSELFNRRWFVRDPSLLINPFGGIDRVRMNPPRGHQSLDRPAGEIDPQVSFIAVRSLDGRPISLLANYSLHYVGGVNKGDVSADYFGYFSKFITQKMDASNQSPPFVAMLSNGTSGDVNNINFADKNPASYQPYEKMQEVAEKIAQRVHEAHKSVKYRDWVSLDAAMTRLPLKVRKPTQEMLDHLAGATEASERPSHRREAIYAKRIDMLQKAPEQISVPLQTFRIGELGIAAIPFETFTETGLRVKKESPLQATFTIELANGSFGYLPTPEQHRLGGYETWLGTNYVEKEASNKIVQSLLDLFLRLKPMDSGQADASD